MAITAALTTKVESTRKLLNSMKDELAKMLPAHIKADTLIRVVMTEVQVNPKLLETTKDSFLKSIMQCGQAGLVPDGINGLAHLVPYKNRKTNSIDCKLIIGYRGLLQLSRRSGEISGIFARCVYQKDNFEYAFGMHPKLNHTETTDPDPGEIAYAYAVAFFKDSSMPMFEVMSRKQLLSVRDRTAYNDPKGPWYTDFDPMCRKTALRKLCKVLPFSTEMMRAVTIDEHNERGLPVPLFEFPDATPPKADDKGNGEDKKPETGKSGKLASFASTVESADGCRKRINDLVSELGMADTEQIDNLLLDISARDEGPYKEMAFDMAGLKKARSIGLMKEVIESLEAQLKQKKSEGVNGGASIPQGTSLFDSEARTDADMTDSAEDPGPEETIGGD